MDTVSPERRSWNMSRIRSADTRPEKVVRSLLHRMGFRFRLHVGELPGCPDIVLPRYRSIIFVHGCFWHRHRGCHLAYVPGSRKGFWLSKFEKNVQRDREVIKQLRDAGWQVFVVWECETRQHSVIVDRVGRIAATMRRRAAVLQGSSRGLEPQARTTDADSR